MHGPLISIIMPAFNASRTLGAAILGVVNQHYKNWELLVIDDGSTEDLKPEVDQFADTRIRYLRLESNAGLATALNTGLREARGRYVARMDSDDVMEDWRLGEQIRFLLIEGLALCGTAARKFGVEGGTIIGPATGQDVIDSFFAGNPFVHPTMMFDRQQLGSDLRYDPDFRCEEDYELWSRLVTRSNCGNMRRPTIKYRVSLSNNANHPAKRTLNRLALDRFAARMGIGLSAPTAELSELQMTGFVDEPGFKKLSAYAHKAASEGWPRLGYLHDPLLQYQRYDLFFGWMQDHQRMSVKLSAPTEHWSDWSTAV